MTNFIELRFFPDLLGFATLRHGPYSQVIAGYIICLVAISAYLSYRPRPSVDRLVFWIFGVALIAFTAMRPLGLNNDDAVYELIVSNICPLFECKQVGGDGRDVIWFASIGILKVFFSGGRAFIVLSAVGIAIKLMVLDRLCTQRTLALLLYIPLIYIQYDFTMLRAGLAISWFFIGILCLTRGNVVIGSMTLLTNGLVHAQAGVSPLVLGYKVFARRWALPCLVVVLISLIYGGLVPRLAELQFLAKSPSTAAYFVPRLSGAWANEKRLALGYLMVFAYAILLCWSRFDKTLTQVVSASIVLALLLALAFVEVPAMQQRLIEFYLAPVVLLAGNIRDNRWQAFATIMLALALYLRLELLHDWILG